MTARIWLNDYLTFHPFCSKYKGQHDYDFLYESQEKYGYISLGWFEKDQLIRDQLITANNNLHKYGAEDGEHEWPKESVDLMDQTQYQVYLFPSTDLKSRATSASERPIPHLVDEDLDALGHKPHKGQIYNHCMNLNDFNGDLEIWWRCCQYVCLLPADDQFSRTADRHVSQ